MADIQKCERCEEVLEALREYIAANEDERNHITDRLWDAKQKAKRLLDAEHHATELFNMPIYYGLAEVPRGEG